MAEVKRYTRVASGEPTFDDNGRIIRYEFSRGDVARDNHTINQAGWVLNNFLANPVFLWVHDASALPVGRVVEIGVVNGRLMGSVEYPTADEYPFADTVYRLVKGKYLNAVSTCWDPIDFKFSTEKGRAGGIDFIKQELWEVSQVPLPAQATALAVARNEGIDTQPIFEWAERVLDTGGMLIVPRSELEALRREARMPKPNKRQVTGAGAPRKRGLYAVGALASLLGSLGWITDDSIWEAQWEEDDSEVPGMLLEAVKGLGAALVAMTIEEVNEMIAGLVENLPIDPVDMITPEIEAVYTEAAKTPGQRALVGLHLALRKAKATPARAGRVLSADNEATLRAAHGAISDACESIMGICDAAASSDDATGDDMAETRGRIAQARRFKALSLITE